MNMPISGVATALVVSFPQASDPTSLVQGEDGSHGLDVWVQVIDLSEDQTNIDVMLQRERFDRCELDCCRNRSHMGLRLMSLDLRSRSRPAHRGIGRHLPLAHL